MRATATLGAKLDRNLKAYAVVSAAGVAVLTAPNYMAVRVIYKHVHIVFDNGGYFLDLNNDAETDFSFSSVNYCSTNFCTGKLDVRPPFTRPTFNAIEVGRAFPHWAAALRRDAIVGAQKRFADYRAYMVRARITKYHTSTFTEGHWANVKNRYLGLRFDINGTIHYGWARLTVKANHPFVTAILTGYAYETKPNKPIVAGDQGTGASLGHLALGASHKRHASVAGKK
jgi:hypothetical protein